MSWTFGSDPELMLVDGDNFRSAIGIINGDKINPINIKGHNYYYDNVMAECAIRYGSSKSEVVDNFRECLQIFADMVKPCKLLPRASHNYPVDQLNHPKAREAGCSPDLCAYDHKQKDAPEEIITGTSFRSCGGHIHLGSKVIASEGPDIPFDGPERILTVYMLDLVLGTTSLWLDRDPSSAARRSLYGQAGRYREKDYGLEYRSLGNFWLVSPKMTELIYDLSMHVLEMVESGQAWDYWSFNLDDYLETLSMKDAWKNNGKYDHVLLRQCIDTGTREPVTDYLKLVKKLLPKRLQSKLRDMINRPKDGEFYTNWGI